MKNIYKEKILSAAALWSLNNKIKLRTKRKWPKDLQPVVKMGGFSHKNLNFNYEVGLMLLVTSKYGRRYK